MDWSFLTPSERYWCLIQYMGWIVLFFIAAWILYKFLVWKMLKNTSPVRVIENPERIQLLGYGRKQINHIDIKG